MFHTWKLFEEDFEDGVVVIITPEGIPWNPCDKTYAHNKPSMTNAKGDLLPSEYIHHKLIVNDDYPSID